MRRVSSLVLLAFALPCCAQRATAHGASAHGSTAPSGPVAVIDTTMGRVVCRLYAKQAPAMTENFVGLVTGTKDWKDGATGQTVHGRPFYDGTGVFGWGQGFGGGDRIGGRKGVAGEPFPVEKTGLMYDRPGRLSMSLGKDGTSSSIFLISGHADAEAQEAGRGAVFGQCDDAGVKVAQAIAHALVPVDNLPSKPVAINHIAIVQPGEPLPPVAPDVDLATVVPQPGRMPIPSIASPEPNGPEVTIDTTQGTLSCRLFKQTPLATDNFVGLAMGTKAWHDAITGAPVKGHFYDGLHFDRVIPDYMVEQGDHPHEGTPTTDKGIGINFGVETVPGLDFDRPGRLAMANAGPDTNGGEWFVTEVPRRSLNGDYTIFGQCDDASVAVVHRIANLPRDAHNAPLRPVTITRVTVLK